MEEEVKICTEFNQKGPVKISTPSSWLRLSFCGFRIRN